MNKDQHFDRHSPFQQDLINEDYCECKSQACYYDEYKDIYMCPNCQRPKEERR